MDAGPAPSLAAEARVRPEQRPTLAPLAVQVLSLLSLPQAAIDELVSEKVGANPLLVMGPARRCRWCGRPARGGECRSCRTSSATPISEQVSTESALDRLGREARAELPISLHSLVDMLVACLDERGFLRDGSEATAKMLARPLADVECVLCAIRLVGPLGVGATDARHSLALQAAWHVEHGAPSTLTRIVPAYLEAVAASDHQLIAGALGVDLGVVDEAVTFLRRRLRPFPVFESTRLDAEPPTMPPDVIVRSDGRSPTGLVVQVLGAADIGLQVDVELVEAGRRGDPVTREWLARRVRDALELVDLVDRRAAALRRIVTGLVAAQAGFVLRGSEHHVAMSRTSLAASLDIHPSTVSRAVQAKVARLPDGRLEPLASFFGRAVPAKVLLGTLLLSDRHPTDAELAASLAAAGHIVARRTVTKYRHQLERGTA